MHVAGEGQGMDLLVQGSSASTGAHGNVHSEGQSIRFSSLAKEFMSDCSSDRTYQRVLATYLSLAEDSNSI